MLGFVILLYACSHDNSAVKIAPPEMDYAFNEEEVIVIPMHTKLRMNVQENFITFQFVTTYEQAAFLRRNAPYLALQTGDYTFNALEVKLGERVELDEQAYYSLLFKVNDTAAGLEDMPKEFETISVFISDHNLFTKNFGGISVIEDSSEEVFHAWTTSEIIKKGVNDFTAAFYNGTEEAIQLVKVFVEESYASAYAIDVLPLTIDANSNAHFDFRIEMYKDIPLDQQLQLYATFSNGQQKRLATYYPNHNVDHYVKTLHNSLK